VAPYELAKRWPLNGSHSTIPYNGYCASDELLAEAIADPNITALIGDMMEKESTPTLDTFAVAVLKL